MKKARIIVISLVALCGDVIADTPLSPAEKYTACSPAGNICATSDPATRTTIVYAQQSKKTLWTIPGWHRWLFVSDDGESVVIGYGGMNLVPVDVTLEEPVLFFYHRGKRVNAVTLGELYQRKAQMRLTASHYAWTQGAAFNKANQLVVKLVGDRTVSFAAATGRRQKTATEAR